MVKLPKRPKLPTKLRKPTLLGIGMIASSPIVAYIMQILVFPAEKIKERLDFDMTTEAQLVSLIWFAIGLLLVYFTLPEEDGQR